MASKRVTSSAVNWAEFAKKIPDAKRPAFNALKSKQDGYVRVIGQLPEKLPQIDWAFYKNRVPQAMLDDFQKKYQALDVPYPKDTLSGEIDSQAQTSKAGYEKFLSESKARSVAIAAELAKWEAMMPVEEMNKEEAMHAVPHLVPEHRPGKIEFWPFDTEYAEFKKHVEKLKAEYDPEKEDH